MKKDNRTLRIRFIKDDGRLSYFTYEDGRYFDFRRFMNQNMKLKDGDKIWLGVMTIDKKAKMVSKVNNKDGDKKNRR